MHEPYSSSSNCSVFSCSCSVQNVRRSKLMLGNLSACRASFEFVFNLALFTKFGTAFLFVRIGLNSNPNYLEKNTDSSLQTLKRWLERSSRPYFERRLVEVITRNPFNDFIFPFNNKIMIQNSKWITIKIVIPSTTRIRIKSSQINWNRNFQVNI